MKRVFSLLLCLVLAVGLLSGCGPSGEEKDPPAPAPEELLSVRELAEAALPRSGKEEGLEVERLDRETDGERLAAYIETVCGLKEDQWEDAAVIRGTGASAFEIVVLRLGDEDAAGKLEPVLAEYLTAREGAFTGYAPAQAEMAANGLVRREERTAGLFICPDPEGAGEAFSAAYKGEALPAPVEAEPEPVEAEPVPAVETEDLMYRLLVEAACPDWRSQKENAWMDNTDIAKNMYGVTPDQYVDFAAGFWGDSLYDHEVTVFLADSEEDAEALAETLSSYRTARAEEIRAEGDTALAEVWENGQTASFGRYAVLIVSDYVEAAVLLFPRAVNDPDTGGFLRRYVQGLQPVKPADPDPDYPDRTRFVPPNEEDMSIYDTSAILAAWEARDPSSLSGDDRAIYDAAEAVLAEIMREDMTEVEKEVAAYGWLVNNVDYDWTHQDALAETDRRSYGPYGGLVNRAAVCLGYAASFQLLMDMSGVECITVVGAAFNSTGDHAWNMVKLDGEWYCVDVTWDDPITSSPFPLPASTTHMYFNVTSAFLRQRDHQWDEAAVEEAAGTALAWAADY